jgi:glutamine amidotransferase
MHNVAIIDYGSGNLHSALKAFERAARDSGSVLKPVLTSDPDVVASADRVVLPGVGAYGDCKRGHITPSDPSLKIPHMGWNTLDVVNPHPLLDGISTGPQGLHAYFVHSYHFLAKEEAHIIARTEYGGPITAMVGKDNMAGTQFHPEKSQMLGLKLIVNFLKWSP